MARFEVSPCAKSPGYIRTTGYSPCMITFATRIEGRLTREQFQYNQFQALGVAEAAVQGQMGAFASTFAPIEDKESAIKILLDILGLGLSLISAGVWNKGRSCS